MTAPTTGCDAGWVSPNEQAAPAGPPTKATLRGDGLPGVEDGDWNADGKIDEVDQILAPDDADGDGEPDLSPSFGPASDSTDPGKNGTGDLFEWLTGDGLNGGGK